MSNCTDCDQVLPLSLLSFTAVAYSDHILFRWETGWEQDLGSFILERSYNGNIFEAVGKVPARNRPGSYTYSTVPATRDAYYRLRMVDIDGSYTYSHTIPVRVQRPAGASAIRLHPSHVERGGSVKLLLPQGYPGKAGVRILNAMGQVLQATLHPGEPEEFTLSTSGLAAGIYIIDVEGPGHSSREKLVVY